MTGSDAKFVGEEVQRNLETNKKEKENCDFFQFMINWKLQNNKICPHDI